MNGRITFIEMWISVIGQIHYHRNVDIWLVRYITTEMWISVKAKIHYHRNVDI